MAENTDKKINRRITLFSFMLSVLVVYLHAKNIEWYKLAQNVTPVGNFVMNFQWFISDNIAKAAVPGFFMLSGLLFYKNFDMSLYKKKMISRFWSLVVPYFCWNILRLLYVIFFRQFIETGLGQIPFTLENILQGIFMYKYNLGYWYMFQLILYTALCPLVYLLIKNKWVGFASIGALLIINLWPGLPRKIPLLLTDSFFFYFLGSFIGRFYFDLIKKEPKNPLLWTVMLFVFSQIMMFLYLKTDFVLCYLVFCVMLASAFFIATALIKDKKMPFWMSFSFFIYSLHGSILELSEKGLYYVFPRNAFYAMTEYLLLPIITIVLIVFVSMFLQNKIPFVWRLLNGGRQLKTKKNRGCIDGDMRDNSQQKNIAL